MPRRQSIYLVAIIFIAVAASTLTIFWQNKPLLGLDLQGGVSVRLTATEPANEEMLDQAVEIIRKRVDALGVAEPEVSRTAEGVMVSLPGSQTSSGPSSWSAPPLSCVSGPSVTCFPSCQLTWTGRA